MTTLPARSFRAALAVTLGLAACLALAGPASAFSVNSDATVPWPFDTITYHVEDDAQHRGAIQRAVRAWNRGGTGYTFQRTDDAASANVMFFENLFVSSEDACTGSTVQGFSFSQSFVILNGDCDRYIMTLAATHELGHLITLNHEDDTCAVMNTRGLANRNNARLARPAECERGRQYWRSPVRRDDRRGENAARRRPFSFPVDLCYLPNGNFQSQLTADEGLCNLQYDCRGVDATAPNDVPSGPALREAGCEEEPYDTSRIESEGASKVRAAKHLLGHDHGHSPGHDHGHAPGHAFGTSPGVEVFGYSK